MQPMSKSDLQIGDILIFENFDFSLDKFFKTWEEDGAEKAAFYLLVYLIPWFDPGKEGQNYRNIYHAAIWGHVDINFGKNTFPKVMDCVVQAGSHGIGAATLESTLNADSVAKLYVYRRKGDLDTDTINKAISDFYYDGSIKYSYSTAWMLAVICSMRYKDGEIRKIILDKIPNRFIAESVIVAITLLINEYSEGHQKDMIACSTLVAMCLKNAGYPIHVEPLTESPELILDDQLMASSVQPEIQLPGSIPEIKRTPIEETIITPRQLFESPDVELVGCFSRSN
tara:strand:- start:1626 stop:2477 length:852 start_codon:yes stop_codon:yes gene_type:complete